MAMEILYDARLVLLSVAVAILAAYAALSLASRVSLARRASQSRAWLAGGALSMGTGIWSMHFIGMLAATLPIRMTYDVGLTLASLLIAVIVSGFALRLVSSKTLPFSRLIGGGTLMGAGIAAMHYVGMAALEIAPAIEYQPLLFAVSILVAMVASGAALWLAFRLRSDTVSSVIWKKAGSAALMGSAISGMHYTGMAAAQVAAGSICTSPDQVDNTWLGITIAAFAVVLLAITLLISVFDAHLAQRSARHARKLLQANQRLRHESLELERANGRLEQEVEQRRLAQAEVSRLNAELECRVAQRTTQLQAANKELEAFSYSIAHDLRAPLTAIDGFRRLLQESCGAAMDDRQRHYFDRIHGSVNQMSELIDALLSLAQVSRASLEWTAVDLGALARSRLERLREAQPRRRVACHIEDGLMAYGDLRLSKIAVENLINNAWKFTAYQPAALIEVGRAVQEDGQSAYFVRDNGAGFDMAYVGKLFRSFQRLHSAKEFPGTGVGLVNVQRIIERHGGRVWVHSSPGHGATFYFSMGNGEGANTTLDAAAAAPPTGIPA